MLSDIEIKKLIKENNIKTVLLQFVDILGSIKTLALPVAQIDKILTNQIAFDGSSVSGFRDNETSDLYLSPDKETFLVYPDSIKALANTARFICDIKNYDGSIFSGCVRSNLKRISNLANEQGYDMHISPEIEFFLLKTSDNNIVVEQTLDKSGYYDFDYSFEKDDALFNIYSCLEDMDYNIQGMHHEAAVSQYEVDLGYDNVLKTADNIITFKHVVKVVADSYGYKASFMPKPLYGHNGSGLHLNISLFKNGQNIFYSGTSSNSVSKSALNIIGSILRNIKGITVTLNPTINSYKRLVKDYEAPIYIVWSVVTRSALLRIANVGTENIRLELRSPDSAMNPYIGFATIFQTCLDGFRTQIDPPQPIEKNLFLLSTNEIKQRKIKSLPRNLFTALEEFEKSLVAKASLGEYIFNEFLNSKRIEWNDYRKQVTPWELSKYLDI